jgi:hypothetical protein
MKYSKSDKTKAAAYWGNGYGIQTAGFEAQIPNFKYQVSSAIFYSFSVSSVPLW